MMVECSKKTDGKILNALDIPQPFESRERTQFASDIHALIATLNGMGWKPGMSLHNEDFRWAIASLKGAFHGFHLDSDGLGTFIQALFGSKWWILASPKPAAMPILPRSTRSWQAISIWTRPRTDGSWRLSSSRLARKCRRLTTFYNGLRQSFNLVSCGQIHLTRSSPSRTVFLKGGTIMRAQQSRIHSMA